MDSFPPRPDEAITTVPLATLVTSEPEAEAAAPPGRRWVVIDVLAVLVLFGLPLAVLLAATITLPAGALPGWLSRTAAVIGLPAALLLGWLVQLAALGVYALLRLVIGASKGRLGTAIAWLIILDLVGFVLYRNAERNVPVKGEVSTAWLVNVESQGRYLVGAADLLEQLNAAAGAGAAKSNPRQDMYKQAKSLDRGSYSQRLRFSVLAGELAGPDEALEALDRLERDRKAGEVEARDISIEAAGLLRRLYRGYKANPKAPPALTDAEQQKLRKGLGWFGELALTPAGSDPAARRAVLAPAVRTAIAYLVMVVAFGLGFLIGLVLLIIVAVRAFTGRMSSGIAARTGHGGIYAETFALYMLFYFSLSLVLGLVVSNERVRALVQPVAYLLAALSMFLSLVVLAWPVLRGIPWQQVRDDLGLRLGKRPMLTVLFGPLTYLCSLPLLVLGLVVMFTLMLLLKRYGLGSDPFEPGTGPSHPIVGVALQKSWWVWLQVFVVASVAAPIVEEIMFRGLLYQHLREVSDTWGRRLSILLSVLASGFIFAVIHPQGWLAVPVLMALASAFALAREWRGSLVPSMLAHGLNNGLVMLLLLMTVG